MALTPNIQLSQANVLAVYNFPSAEVDVSQASVLTVAVSDPTPVDVSQFKAMAIVKSRTSTINARSFTFSLDGHDFYCVRAGDEATLVYDLTTDTWTRWASKDLDFLRINQGINWIGISGKILTDNNFNSDVVLGDDSTGRLYVIDPTQGYDEATRDTLSDEAFTRKILGGVLMRVRDTQKVGAVYLTMDSGAPSITGASIALRTSDDYGKTWQDHGAITVTPGDYEQEFVWRSLGLVKAPGRLFELTDTGATVRIDSLDMR